MTYTFQINRAANLCLTNLKNEEESQLQTNLIYHMFGWHTGIKWCAPEVPWNQRVVLEKYQCKVMILLQSFCIYRESAPAVSLFSRPCTLLSSGSVNIQGNACGVHVFECSQWLQFDLYYLKLFVHPRVPQLPFLIAASKDLRVNRLNCLPCKLKVRSRLCCATFVSTYCIFCV